LVVALSHFPELETELELLRSGHNVDLTEDHVDALWIQACPTLNSLSSHILPSIAHNPLDGAGE
jgi:hypothetical protein